MVELPRLRNIAADFQTSIPAKAASRWGVPTVRGVTSAIIGIDPGSASGAVAILWISGGEVEGAEVHDLPTVKVGKKTKPNEAECADLLDLGLDVRRVTVGIEQVSARPGQGVVSCFSFGFGLGLWVGIASARKYQWSMIRPQAWKREMLAGIADKGKEAARARAQILFPGLIDDLKLKKHHNRAEALLIAEYMRRRQ